MGGDYEGQKETCHVIGSNTCGFFLPVPIDEMGNWSFALL